MKVYWLQAAEPDLCERCDGVIAVDKPLVWIPDSEQRVCFDCGCAAEDTTERAPR